jgi:hypothetical protein
LAIIAASSASVSTSMSAREPGVPYSGGMESAIPDR